MKSLLVLLSLVFSLSAFAQKVVVYEENLSNDWYDNGSFAINRELGRAWVTINFTVAGPGDDVRTREARALVEGLRFDTTTNKVVWDIEGRQVECATVVQRRVIVRYNAIYPTGNCVFSKGSRKVQVDDGYHVRTQTIFQSFLEAK